MQRVLRCLTKSLCWQTYSILEAEERHLQLTDGGAVEVQVQLQHGQGVSDNLPVRHANKVSQTGHQGGDVLRFQLQLLTALQRREGMMREAAPAISSEAGREAPSLTCPSASIRFATTLSWSSVMMRCSVARLSLSFRSMKKPESFSSGEGGALWSSKFSTGMLGGKKSKHL